MRREMESPLKSTAESACSFHLAEQPFQKNDSGEDAFSRCHPLNGFLYFAIVLTMTMFVVQPVVLLISLTGAAVYHRRLSGENARKFSFLYMLPLFLLTAVMNPLFNHAGTTILAHFPDGNPLTLESVIYGLCSAVMMTAVITWFACGTVVLTSDKFVYLFGRAIPALSLVLSMALHFVPVFAGRLRQVNEAQKSLGRDIGGGTLRQRIGSGIRIFSILITWSMENAIDTADSMNCRGYGLPGRTAFSIYRFDTRDRLMLLWLLFCAGMLIAGVTTGAFRWDFYPVITAAPQTVGTVCFELLYLALVLTPLFPERTMRADCGG